MQLKHLLAPSLLASALLLSAGHALAGADLSVNGHIRPGGACSLTLGNGGTLDLGTISRKDLKEAKETAFLWWNHEISLGIHCQAPTKVAFRALDNRAGTSTHDNMFGLGASGGKNVGAFTVIDLEEEIIGDGTKLVHLVDWSDKGSSWEAGYGAIKATPHLSSWAEPGQSSPQAFQNISSRMGVYGIIAPVKDLDQSQEIAIDGSATMELVYL